MATDLQEPLHSSRMLVLRPPHLTQAPGCGLVVGLGHARGVCPLRRWDDHVSSPSNLRVERAALVAGERLDARWRRVEDWHLESLGDRWRGKKAKIKEDVGNVEGG